MELDVRLTPTRRRTATNLKNSPHQRLERRRAGTGSTHGRRHRKESWLGLSVCHPRRSEGRQARVPTSACRAAALRVRERVIGNRVFVGCDMDVDEGSVVTARTWVCEAGRVEARERGEPDDVVGGSGSWARVEDRVRGPASGRECAGGLSACRLATAASDGPEGGGVVAGRSAHGATCLAPKRTKDCKSKRAAAERTRAVSASATTERIRARCKAGGAT